MSEAASAFVRGVGELYGEGYAIQPLADPDHGRRVFDVELEAR